LIAAKRVSAKIRGQRKRFRMSASLLTIAAMSSSDMIKAGAQPDRRARPHRSLHQGPRARLLQAQTIVLLLHELSTNAIKYGALSNGTGRVELDFEVKQPTNQTDAPALMGENGGPSVAPPPTKGFGVSLLERLARGQEPDRPVLDWRAQGLRCSIILPISPPRRR
jgi:two-component sensor histidine kinase